MATAGAVPARRTHGAGPVVGALAVAVLLGTVGCSSPASDTAAADVAAAEVSVDDDSGATEVDPEVTTAAPAPEPLVTAEPDAYSEVGDLVDGFPIDLLPVPRDAVILVTSAVPVGDADVQEVSLNLRTSATAGELLELYRGALTAASFTELTDRTSDSDLAVDVTFTRSSGDELVSIGVLDVDGARTVTIGGRVRTKE